MITTPTKRTKQCRFLPRVSSSSYSRFSLRAHSPLRLFFFSPPCHDLHSCLGDVSPPRPSFLHIYYFCHSRAYNPFWLFYIFLDCIQSRFGAPAFEMKPTEANVTKVPTHPNSVSKLAAVFCFDPSSPYPFSLLPRGTKSRRFFSVSLFCISLRLVLILMFCSFSPWTSLVWVLDLGSKRAKRFWIW
jgi:hypothetical protein